MNRFKHLISAAILLVIGACSLNEGVSTEDAKKIAEKYMLAMQAEDYKAAFAYYGKRFFNSLPREAWQERIAEVHTKLGKTTGYKLNHEHSDLRYSGSFFVFQYIVDYEHGRTKETLTLVKELDSDEGLKIFAHKIESKQL